MEELVALDKNSIYDRIFTIRGLQVMVDRDLADKTELVANYDRFKSIKHSNCNPYAFSKMDPSSVGSILEGIER